VLEGKSLGWKGRHRLMRKLASACGGIGKASLLAGSALSLVAALPAAAQTATDLPTREKGVARPILPEDLPKPPSPPPAPPPGDDGLGSNGFYLEADNLIRDDKNNVWTARGQVEARYQGHVIRGDEVVYHVTSGTVTVDGHAHIINADGTAVAADHVVLDDKLRAGFARGFSSEEELPINSSNAYAGSSVDVRFGADIAIRRSETVNELDRAVYTPCSVCAANGSPKTPTWSIRASKVIQDHVKHVIYYRNAVIQVKGLPVFYAPVFWHPDPQSPRASGLLMPQMEVSNKRGLSYQQAYYWVLSPSQDLFISPQINTKVAPLLNLEYRQRFYSGQLDVRAGYTYERDFNGEGERFGDLTSRSYILAHGAFDLNKDWSWGFTADRTSDRYIFDKYDISNVYQGTGQAGDVTQQFSDLSQKLTSDIYLTRQDSQSYISISALSFQGLVSTDNNRTFPLVAPLIEARYVPSQDILGGRLSLSASGVLLARDQSPINPLEPGVDSRRATGEADWLRTFTLSDGIRLEPFVDVREDLYNVADQSAANTGAKTYTRSSSDLGLNVSWPFIRQGGGTTVVLEPMAQVLLAPNASNNPNIPNEDSQVFTFDESNLFSINKFAGYDLVDGGDRLNLAGRATIDWGDGEDARVFIGRTFRAQPTNIYPLNTGLDGRASDWVVAADTTPLPGLTVFGRALLNDRGNFESQEYGVDVAYDRGSGYLRYETDNTQVPLAAKTANVEAAGEYFVTKNWGLSAVAVRDLEVKAWRLRDLGIIYRDDCIRVEVVYQHEDTINGVLGKSDSVFMRLTLATLGDQRYKNADFR
jgi:LPS-assembly protein